MKLWRKPFLTKKEEFIWSYLGEEDFISDSVWRRSLPAGCRLTGYLIHSGEHALQG